jgi:hypothetical protein
MGRHVNADAELDEHPDVTRERLRLGGAGLGGAGLGGADLGGADLGGADLGGAAQGHPLEPQAYISPDTHVGFDAEVASGTPDAAASPSHPDALVQGGLVGDGHELE